jgi:hypothetical protein
MEISLRTEGIISCFGNKLNKWEILSNLISLCSKWVKILSCHEIFCFLHGKSFEVGDV